MTRLFLLRHAKARWAEPGQRDFDRDLAEPRGPADCRLVAEEMRRRRYLPDQVVSSSARRTRATWEAVAPVIGGAPRVTFHDELYEATAQTYLDVIRAQAGSEAILLIGHNPIMEDLASALTKSASADAAQAIEGGFPTAGLAVFTFEGPAGGIEPGAGRLDDFIRPSRLRAA